jgi:hypothetical protein
MTTCANTSCSKEFVPTKSSQRFCSDSCRAKDHRRQRASGNLGNSPMPTIETKPEPTIKIKPVEKFDLPEGLSPQANWIIRHQDRNLDTLQQQNEKLLGKIETITSERDKLRNELAEFKTDSRIKDIENTKPTGLAGILPNGIEGLLSNPFIGPVIGAVLTKVMNAHSIGPVPASAEGEQNALATISQWLGSQSEDVQHSFATLISSIIQLDAGKVAATLQQLNNVLKVGSTIQNQTQNATVNASGTFNY